MTTQTNGDDLEWKKFEKWCSSEYPKLDGEIVMGNDVALIANPLPGMHGCHEASRGKHD